MDEDTQRELRRKKIFFNFKDMLEPSHRCMGKGNVHYIEVVSDEEDDGHDKGIIHDNDEPSQNIE
jgi:hypothetical protein